MRDSETGWGAGVRDKKRQGEIRPGKTLRETDNPQGRRADAP